jgi:hypothetical protein
VTTGQGTALAAGKYITRKVFVEVLSDGAGYSATRIEYQITRFLSILGTISTLGRTGANVRVPRTTERASMRSDDGGPGEAWFEYQRRVGGFRAMRSMPRAGARWSPLSPRRCC